MQDVDRPPDVEVFALPAWARGSRVRPKTQRFVRRAQRLGGIVGDRWRRRYSG